MLVNLRVLLGRLVDIVLLRGGPESLPASPGVLAMTIFLNVVVSVVVFALIPTTGAFSPLEMLLSIVIPLLWFKVSFALAKKPERFVQTMIAYFGINTLFQPLIAPMSFALLPYVAKQDPNMPPPAALSLLFLAILVWGLVVSVRVVHAAFEWRYLAAIAFVFAEGFATLVIYAAVFGIAVDKV